MATARGADASGRGNATWADDWAAFAGEGALEEQVRFEREWLALRAYAAERDVRIIGDVPIYVAVDGCDHRAHPELFLPLDEVVAGAPPDGLNDLGQLWGNPLYDWVAMARTATAGGSSGCAACWTSSTSSGSTTSVGSQPSGRSRPAPRPRATATGRAGPVSPSSAPPRRSSADSP